MNYIRTYFSSCFSLHRTVNYTRGFTTVFHAKCRKCSTSLSHNDLLCFFCKGCQWPVESTHLSDISPFDVFNVPKVYNIDKARLNQQFKSYQFALHPDKHASKQEEELQLITENSSVINGHYKCLIDDKSRAKLLFSLRYGEEKFQDEVNKSDGLLLDDIMEMHERVQCLEDAEEASAMRKEIEAVIEDAIGGLTVAFDQDDTAAIVKHFQTLSFYKQLLEQVKEFKEE